MVLNSMAKNLRMGKIKKSYAKAQQKITVSQDNAPVVFILSQILDELKAIRKERKR